MLVARSDPDAPKHKGLTYFILDMDQDGVEVRPLRQITGEAEFNEIFMEGAYIPDENRIGDEGNGWNVAITTLMHERAGLGAASAVAVRRELDELIETLRERGLGDDPLVRERIAKLQIGVESLRLGSLRALTAQMKVGIPGPEGSVAKWQWADTNQGLSELASDVLGADALATDSTWAYRMLRARANSIEGGTTEVMKNILAERVLGLPRLR
jgi:alkylation response protein AidB-like acyl-CoA dehydrogenase